MRYLFAAAVLVISMVTIGSNLIVDMTYAFIDPRIKRFEVRAWKA